MKKTGDRVTFLGQEIVLGKSLGGGGEGSVFEVSVQTKKGSMPAAVKVIDTKKKTEREILKARRQIQQLIDIRNRSKEKAKTPGYEALSTFMTLPQAILEEDVGYVMAKVDGYEPLTNYITIPESVEERESWQKKYDLRRRYKVIAYLFERLEKIHIEGLIFSDLSPSNILISQKADATPKFIDTDNLRTKTSPFTNVLGTPGFIAPEIYRKSDSAIALTEPEAKQVDDAYLLSEESDIFSAAIIAFELLTFNHPFKGVKAMGEDTTPEDEQAAERGEMDYILKPGTDNYCEGNIFLDKFDDITTPEIRGLFFRTFVEGKLNPLRRPTAGEFKSEFQRASRLIVQCSYCGEEMIYSVTTDGRGHPYSRTMCINPECERKIDGQLLLTIYANGNGKSPDDVILGPASSNHKGQGTIISSILLREGEKEKLYFPDIGISGDLKEANRFCELTVKEGVAFMKVFRQPEGSIIEVVSTKGKPPVPVTETVSFPYDHDYLLFHNIKTKHGTLTIIGQISRI